MMLTSNDTMHKVQGLDAADNMFILLAHDVSLRDRIPLCPEKIHGWRSENLRPIPPWSFVGDLETAALHRSKRVD